MQDVLSRKKFVSAGERSTRRVRVLKAAGTRLARGAPARLRCAFVGLGAVGRRARPFRTRPDAHVDGTDTRRCDAAPFCSRRSPPGAPSALPGRHTVRRRRSFPAAMSRLFRVSPPRRRPERRPAPERARRLATTRAARFSAPRSSPTPRTPPATPRRRVPRGARARPPRRVRFPRDAGTPARPRGRKP